jgi:hypothetical protein
VTQAQEVVNWDVVLFNFGLHDMDSNQGGGPKLYQQQLINITNRLLETNASLIYATTTPFMPYASVGNGTFA